MINLRVYELARDMNLTSSELVKHMLSNGISIKSHMSALSPTVANKIRASILRNNRSVQNLKKPNHNNYADRTQNIESCRDINPRLMRNLPPWFNIENWEKDLHIKEHVMMEQIKNLGLIEKYKNDELKDLDVKKLIKIINSNYMLGELADKFKINRKDFLIFFNDKFNLNIKSLEKTIAKDKIISLLKDNPEIYSGKFKLPDPIKDNTFLIDGLNICYGFSKAKKQISIKYLLTLVKEIIIHGGQFICVFDRDTFTQFKCLNPSEIKYVKEVVSKARCQFGMVKGKLVTDDVLLNRVENDNHFIISHDKYFNYKKKYAVLYSYPNKFKQFMLFYEKRNGRIVEIISVPRLGILKPVRNDLEKLTKEILTLLRREPPPS